MWHRLQKQNSCNTIHSYTIETWFDSSIVVNTLHKGDNDDDDKNNNNNNNNTLITPRNFSPTQTRHKL